MNIKIISSVKGVTQYDVDHVLTVGQPYVHPIYQVGKNIDVTISGIGAAGALDHDMNIIEADVTYRTLTQLRGQLTSYYYNRI